MKHRTTITLFLVAFFVGFGVDAADTQNFSYHGIKLGVNEKTLLSDFPEFNCEADQSNPELRRCKAKFDQSKRPGVFETLSGGGLDTFLTFHNDKLVNIGIPFFRTLFEPGSLLFVQHYGQPKMTQKLIKNKEGNEQHNTILIWTQGNESIIYWKIDEDRFVKENDDYNSRILFLLKE